MKTTTRARSDTLHFHDAFGLALSDPVTYLPACVNSGVESEGFVARNPEAERGSEGQGESTGGHREWRQGLK